MIDTTIMDGTAPIKASPKNHGTNGFEIAINPIVIGGANNAINENALLVTRFNSERLFSLYK